MNYKLYDTHTHRYLIDAESLYDLVKIIAPLANHTHVREFWEFHETV